MKFRACAYKQTSALCIILYIRLDRDYKKRISAANNFFEFRARAREDEKQIYSACACGKREVIIISRSIWVILSKSACNLRGYFIRFYNIKFLQKKIHFFTRRKAKLLEYRIMKLKSAVVIYYTTEITHVKLSTFAGNHPYSIAA